MDLRLFLAFNRFHSTNKLLYSHSTNVSASIALMAIPEL